MESSAADRAEPAEASQRGPAGRLLHVAGGLLAIHVQVAQTELAEEQSRIARGIVLLALSWMCLFVGVLLVQTIVIISLHDLLRLRWLFAASATALLNLLIWLVLHALGSRQLHAPVLPTTRALLRKTLSALNS